MPLKINGIFFDLGNVLVKYDASITAKKLAEALKISQEQVWKDLFVSGLERSYTTGKISSKEFYQKIKDHYPHRLSFEVFSEIWNNIFFENEGMDDLVQSLAKRYPLYLISNTNELHFDYIKSKFPVLQHFKQHFPSHEVGHRKPDEAIFRHALRESKLKAEESVFIDDILEFIEAARRVGMHGIHFVSREQLMSDLRQLGVSW